MLQHSHEGSLPEASEQTCSEEGSERRTEDANQGSLEAKEQQQKIKKKQGTTEIARDPRTRLHVLVCELRLEDRRGLRN